MKAHARHVHARDSALREPGMTTYLVAKTTGALAEARGALLSRPPTDASEALLVHLERLEGTIRRWWETPPSSYERAALRKQALRLNLDIARLGATRAPRRKRIVSDHGTHR